jgi:zinc transporter ZupT
MTAGFLLLFTIDRYLYPVCPACAPSHGHDACSTRLHGFAGPLIFAALLHSTFDGWALAAGLDASERGLGSALSLGVALHKLPEGIAFGVILRAAMKSKTKAFWVAAITQGSMLIGGWLERWSSAYIGVRAVSALLALGGGTFLYLGYHAVHSEWRRRTAAHKHAVP